MNGYRAFITWNKLLLASASMEDHQLSEDTVVEAIVILLSITIMGGENPNSIKGISCTFFFLLLRCVVYRSHRRLNVISFIFLD